MRIIISCMDYRLTEEVMKEVKDGTLVFRNAGANVAGLEKELRELKDVEEVIYMPHNDCAAMKLTLAVLQGKDTLDRREYEHLVKQFEGKRFDNLAELEKENALQGVKKLMEIFPNARITLRFIDVNKIKWPEKKAKVCITTPDKKLSNEVVGMYVLSAMKKETVEPDLKIAQEKLNLKDTCTM